MLELLDFFVKLSAAVLVLTGLLNLRNQVLALRSQAEGGTAQNHPADENHLRRDSEQRDSPHSRVRSVAS